MGQNCGNSVNKYIIVETPKDEVVSGMTICGDGLVTNIITPCEDILKISGDTEFHGNITPNIDVSRDIGTTNKRFREINTFKGNSTLWVSTQEINTPNLNLGLDSNDDNRTITANNSIIRDDTLLGGTY